MVIVINEAYKNNHKETYYNRNRYIDHWVICTTQLSEEEVLVWLEDQ